MGATTDGASGAGAVCDIAGLLVAKTASKVRTLRVVADMTPM
jgi:hypothetical protein